MKTLSSAIALFAAVCSASTFAGEAGSQLIKFGAASVSYNNDSTELKDSTGLPLTPAGITASAEDSNVALLEYDYFVTDDWSIQLAAGVPPTVKLTAGGTAAALGNVGETSVLTPAVLGLYHFDLADKLSAYVGAGVNYTKFNDVKIYENYEQAFGGASTGSIDDNIGPVVKLGASYAMNENWSVDLAYSHYWVTSDIEVTTDTPQIGKVTRSISIDADPDIFSMTVGYQF
ncbi:OmpW family outer membrane protein [Microbulbifer sp. SAOS-129_SWC]|uniref:OmpW/AlkL family protein n=1 Tax=Microbulbifer sp. SAOS-129_SWC TaxID=3145235 RepID=UPI003216D4D0